MSTYPPELAQFIRHELATGQHANEGELVVHALRVYRELKTRHDALRADVETAIAQADCGELEEWDVDAFLDGMHRQHDDQQG